MKIKKLKIKNIRSYEEEEIEFPDGNLLLSGSVGSGKTSLLLAIEYALFGLQPGFKGSALLRNGSLSGEVVLEFEIDDKKIIIERRLKKGNKNITGEYTSIEIDGNKIESSITEVKNNVLNLLNYPMEFIRKNNLLYRYTVYTPQEQMKEIVTEDSETRLTVLRHIFGVEKYKKIRENNEILINNLKEESKILQGEIKNLEQEKEFILSIIEKVKNIEEKEEEKEEEFRRAKAERKIVEEEYSNLNERIKEKEKFHNELEKTKLLISTKRDNLFNINNEIEKVEKDILLNQNFKKEELDEINKKIKQMKINFDKLNQKYIGLISKINYIEDNKKELSEKKGRIYNIRFCPTCLQNVPEIHKYNILNQVENELSKIEKDKSLIEDEIIRLKKEIEKDELEIKKIEEKKLELEIKKSKQEQIKKSIEKVNELKKQKDNHEKDILLLEGHINRLKQQIFEFSRFDNLVKLKKEELEKCFKTEREFEIKIAEFKKEKEMLSLEMKRKEKEIYEKEKSKDRLNKINDVINWLGNYFLNLVEFIERQVLIKLRREFSILFSKWFYVFVPQESFEVHVDETFTPVIIHKGIEMDYSFLSGGERTALALAYRLALNQTINSVFSSIKTKDLLILDEPTEGFSDVQIDKIKDIIKELKLKQLIIVSHEQKIENFVDHVIKLKKENDSSKIVS